MPDIEMVKAYQLQKVAQKGRECAICTDVI